MYPNFTPLDGKTQTASPSASNVTITLVDDSDQVMLQPNAGSAKSYYKTGLSSATATTADLPLQAGAIYVITKPRNHRAIAIYSAGAATVDVTPGQGS